jgi:uncharacterized membrane protein
MQDIIEQLTGLSDSNLLVVVKILAKMKSSLMAIAGGLMTVQVFLPTGSKSSVDMNSFTKEAFFWLTSELFALVSKIEKLDTTDCLMISTLSKELNLRQLSTDFQTLKNSAFVK